MKDFIKVIDVNEEEHYLNINFIIRFTTISEDYKGNTIIYLQGTQKSISIQTNSTPQEVVDMIDLASK